MRGKAERINVTSGRPDATAYQALNEQLSQSLLAVRLLLTQAQEKGADRLALIKRCDRYLSFALEDLRKLRDSGDGEGR
jgi:hypothetical protein